MRIKNIETSKKILVASWAATIVLTVMVIICTFAQVDVSELTVLAGLAWGELTAAHGFYYWKARSENRQKGVKSLIKEIAETYGIDAVASIAEVIYRE